MDWNLMRLGVLSALLFTGVAPAHAASFDFVLDQNIGEYQGSLGYIEGSFRDNGTNTVTLDLSLAHLTQGFVSRISFNYAPTAGAAAIKKVSLDGFELGGTVGGVSLSNKSNFDRVGGWGSAGKFDFEVSFPTSKVGNRFVAGESISIDLIGTGLTAAMFNAKTANNFLAAAHIQALTKDSGGVSSAKIAAVPLPAMAPLFGVAIFGLGALSRRQRKAGKAA